MPNSAERQHLGSIFARGHVSDRLAVRAHQAALRPDVAIGVDFHLYPAVAENSFRHHRYHVYASDFRGDDERGRFVVRIGGSGTNGRDKGFWACHDVSVPLALAFEKGHNRVASFQGAIQDHMRVDSDELPRMVGIAIAGPGSSRLDVAEHWTRIATNRVAVSHEARQVSSREGVLLPSARGGGGGARVRS